MKIFPSKFRRLVASGVTLLLLVCCSLARAELFLGPTTPQNRLIVGTNEVIAVTGEVYNEYQPRVFSTFISPIGEYLVLPSFRYIAGPAEVIFTNHTAVVNFVRFTNSDIKTDVVSPSRSLEIDVPPGKRIKFLQPPVCTSIQLLQGGKLTPEAQFYAGDIILHHSQEFSGPVKLFLRIPDYCSSSVYTNKLITYSISDQAVILPTGSTLQAPPGILSVALEKSSNLTNWSPMIEQTTVSDSPTFYRMRIRK